MLVWICLLRSYFCCLCLGHACSSLQSVRRLERGWFVCCDRAIAKLFLSGRQESNFLEIFDSLGYQAFWPEYDPCDSVDADGREQILQERYRSYKAVRVASVVKSSSFSSVGPSPDELAVQRRTPAQRPKIDLVKTGRSDDDLNLASKLRALEKTGGKDVWRIIVYFVYSWSCFLFIHLVFMPSKRNWKLICMRKKEKKRWKTENGDCKLRGLKLSLAHINICISLNNRD